MIVKTTTVGGDHEGRNDEASAPADDHVGADGAVWVETLICRLLVALFGASSTDNIRTIVNSRQRQG